MDEIQPFYDFLTIHTISSSSVGCNKKLNGPHMTPGPYFAHACTWSILLNCFTVRCEFCPSTKSTQRDFIFLGCFGSWVTLLGSNDTVRTKDQGIKRQLLASGVDSCKNSSETCWIWLQKEKKVPLHEQSNKIIPQLCRWVCQGAFVDVFCAGLQAALHRCLPSPGYSDPPAPVHSRVDSLWGRQEPVKAGGRGRGVGVLGFQRCKCKRGRGEVAGTPPATSRK